jgi:hypothetical protein
MAVGLLVLQFLRVSPEPGWFLLGIAPETKATNVRRTTKKLVSSSIHLLSLRILLKLTVWVDC